MWKNKQIHLCIDWEALGTQINSRIELLLYPHTTYLLHTIVLIRVLCWGNQPLANAKAKSNFKRILWTLKVWICLEQKQPNILHLKWKYISPLWIVSWSQGHICYEDSTSFFVLSIPERVFQERWFASVCLQRTLGYLFAILSYVLCPCPAFH